MNEKNSLREDPVLNVSGLSPEFNKLLNKMLEGKLKEEDILNNQDLLTIGIHAKLDVIIDKLNNFGKRLSYIEKLCLNDIDDPNVKVKQWLRTTSETKE